MSSTLFVTFGTFENNVGYLPFCSKDHQDDDDTRQQEETQTHTTKIPILSEF